MAYANAVPWHGLGNRVDSEVTVEGMLDAAGLNWSVSQHDCFTEFNGNKLAVGRKALVRSTDGKVLSTTSESWKPLQNKDALEFFRDYAEAGGATLETAGSLRGGKTVWGLAKVATDFAVNGTDKVGGYVLLSNSHEPGYAIKVMATTVRVVCANTLAAAHGGKANYVQNHMKDFDVEAAKATIELARQQIAKLGIDAQALASLKMSEFDTVRLLARYFQPMGQAELAEYGSEDLRTTYLLENEKARDIKLRAVLNSTKAAPGADPDTAWGVLNGVTYWADHVASRSQDTRLFNSWLGSTAKLKGEVLTNLLEMAS